MIEPVQREIWIQMMHPVFKMMNVLQEIADKMLPSLSELGVETEGNSGQFFYPPGGFRTWHTNGALYIDRFFNRK